MKLQATVAPPAGAVAVPGEASEAEHHFLDLFADLRARFVGSSVLLRWRIPRGSTHRAQ